LERDQSIDAFERDPGRLDGIAQGMGYETAKKSRHKQTARAGQKLLRDYEARRERIRACYERYFLPKDKYL